MPLIRSGGRIRVSDPRRGACGDCPGVPYLAAAEVIPPPLLEQAPDMMTGFEGGVGEADLGAAGIASFTWTGQNPYFSNFPPMRTDIVHSGTYAMQVGGEASGGSLAGLDKVFAAVKFPPFTIAQKLYFYLVNPNSPLMYLGEWFGTLSGVFFGVASVGTHINLEVGNAPGAPHVLGSAVLASFVWYRLYAYMTVDAAGVWSAGATVYLGDTMTVVEDLLLSGTGFPNAGAGQFRLGDIFDIVPSSQCRVDDLVLSTGVPLSREPFALALVNPITDVSTQWTRAGSAPAASNALNVGRLPGHWTTGDDQQNTATAPNLVDLFALDISRVPIKAYKRMIVQARSITGATFGYRLRVSNPSGFVDGPEVTTQDGLSQAQRTDDLTAINLVGVTRSQLATYQFGYISTGPAASLRKMFDLWGTVEYDPTT